MEINELPDALVFVSDNEKMFFVQGRASAEACVLLLVGDALALGVSEVGASHYGDWWVVGSPEDWLETDVCSVESLFSRLIPLPQAGVNSTRSEVVVRAFAAAVSVWTPTGLRSISGEVAPESLGVAVERAHKNWVRAVLFRFSP